MAAANRIRDCKSCYDSNFQSLPVGGEVNTSLNGQSSAGEAAEPSGGHDKTAMCGPLVCKVLSKHLSTLTGLHVL